MFETTGSMAQPLFVRASFWQCFKAGVAFTAGAMVVAFFGSLFWFAIMLRVYPMLMLGALQR